MVSVKRNDLSLAFEFVSSDAPLMHEAYICLDTGRIFWISQLAALEDEEVADDFGASDRYLAIPHKNDLDLGKRLALRFAAQELSPRSCERTENFFRHKGAYARFREILESEHALEKWHQFEADAIEEALKNWCSENDIEQVD
jgi:hypothetical protein